METFLLKWLQYEIQPKVRERTYQTYQQIVRRDLLPVLGQITLQKLTSWDIQDLYQQKRCQRVAASTIVAAPKSPTSRRCIQLPQLAIEALTRHQQRHHATRHKGGRSKRALEWVFCDAQGVPLRATSVVRQSFHPLLAQADLPHIRFHDLRHSTATLLLTLGVHPKIVQELLGHSQIFVTLDIYSHVLPTLQSEAMQQFHEALTEYTSQGGEMDGRDLSQLS